MATIYLIRHGESAANAGLKTFGTATIPLTPLGQSQAQEVPEHLPNHLEYII
ncbi:phosphoglycerate mutase family protein, partial [Veillonella sp.]